MPKERDEKGRFVPGQSGNPKGRPPAVTEIQQLLSAHRKDLVNRALELAMHGDPTALSVCFRYLAPAPRSETPPVEIPGLAEAESMEDKARAILAAAANAQVSPDVVERLLSALRSYAELTEIPQLREEIAALRQEQEERG
jgi:hypothetical protein